MPRRCSICSHDRRGEIDAALVEGVPNRRIAAQYEVSEQAVRRHKEDRIPEHLARSREAEEVAEADDLLGQLRELQRRSLSILDAAESVGDLPTALRAIGQARSNLELLGKLAGELQDGPQVNVHLSAEWVQIRAVLLDALTPYPEARQTVARRLQEVEGGSG